MKRAARAALDRVNAARRRDWWALAMPTRFRFAILCCWTLEPIIRGIDYITGESTSTSYRLSVVENAAPLSFWGALFLLGGILTLLGIAGRWMWPISVGSLVCGATYLTIALGLTVECIERGGDGFRTPTMFAIFGITWLTMAIGYRSQLRQKEILRDLGVDNGRAD